MKIKATIVIGIEYKTGGDFPDEELLEMETCYLKDNLLKYVDEFVANEQNVTIDINVKEVKL